MVLWPIPRRRVSVGSVCSTRCGLHILHVYERSANHRLDWGNARGRRRSPPLENAPPTGLGVRRWPPVARPLCGVRAKCAWRDDRTALAGVFVPRPRHLIRREDSPVRGALRGRSRPALLVSAEPTRTIAPRHAGLCVRSDLVPPVRSARTRVGDSWASTAWPPTRCRRALGHPHRGKSCRRRDHPCPCRCRTALTSGAHRARLSP